MGYTKAQQKRLCRDLGLTPLPYSLRECQFDALRTVGEGKNLLVAWPTGCGKTTVALAVAARQRAQAMKTAICVPLKSLNAEHAQTFTEAGFKVVCAYGDARKDTAFFKTRDFEDADVLITTNETLDSIMSKESKRELVLPALGAIVFDEIHHLGESERGPNLENLIAVLKTNWAEIQIVGLSATLGNIKQIAEWLDAELNYVPPEDRPVPLELNFLQYNKQYYSFDIDGRFIPNSKENMEIRMGMILRLISRHPDATFLIFCSSRARTTQVANEIARRVFHSRDRYRWFNDNRVTNMMDAYPVAFHNAGLSAEQRAEVEQAFREGSISIVCCTPTLAQGVNLPADVCIMFDVEYWDRVTGQFLIDANSLQQTIGRAGRPGMSDKGFAYIISPIDKHASSNYRTSEFTCGRVNDVPAEIEYRSTTPLEVSSQMLNRLYHYLLKWIAGGNARTIEELILIAKNSLAEFEGRINEATIMQAIKWLMCYGFVTLEEDILKASWFGKQAVNFYLMPETVLEMRTQSCCFKDSRDFRETFIRILSNEEYLSAITVRAEDKEIIEIAEQELGRFFPYERKCKRKCLTCALREGSPDRERTMIESGTRDIEPACEFADIDTEECPTFVLRANRTIDKRLLKAFVLTFADDLIEKYDLYRRRSSGQYYTDRRGKKQPTLVLSSGDKYMLEQAARRFFTAAGIILGYNENIKLTCEELEMMVSSGTLSPEKAYLRKIKGIGPVSATKLIEAGIDTIGKFLEAQDTRISRIIGKATRIVRVMKQSAREILSKQ